MAWTSSPTDILVQYYVTIIYVLSKITYYCRTSSVHITLFINNDDKHEELKKKQICAVGILLFFFAQSYCCMCSVCHHVSVTMYLVGEHCI